MVNVFIVVCLSSPSNIVAAHVGLQKKLLDKQNHQLKPDAESFANVVGSRWPSLASSLSLSVDEIANVTEEGLTRYPARLCPQDAEKVVGKRKRHIWSALPGTQNHPIISAWQLICHGLTLCASHPWCL